jgi:hypothetical protein
MTKVALLKAVALSSAMMVSAAANAATLYDQPYDGSGTLFASQNDTGGGNGNFATLYDNFTLAGGGNITGVSFTGGYFNPGPPGNITAFTVSFYADNAGQPGGAVATASIGGNGGESCGGAICTYSLAVNFAAAAGTQYWMSIVPDEAFPPQGGWATATNGDGVSFQDFFGARSPLAADLAFTLTGDAGAVPEPTTWALMLGGFGLAGAALRRRQRPAVSLA